MPAVKLTNPALYLPLLLHLVAAQPQLTTPFASLPGMTTQQVLRSILPHDVIPYSAAVTPQEAGAYKAVLRVHNRGMEHLYTFTNMFLSFIQPPEVVPPGIELSLDPELMLSQARTEWRTILVHYAGITATAAIGVLLALAIPLIGFFICCCRCGGRCGAKDEPFEKRRDKCKRVILGLFLGILLLLVVFGIICAFVSNSNVQDGVNGLPPTLRNAAHDTSIYFNSTRRAYTTLLTVNYRELESALSKALDDSGRLVTDELKYVSRAVAMDNLTSIASNLGQIRAHLNDIERDTQRLQDHARELKSGLADVKGQLEVLLQQCKDLPACEVFKSQYPLDKLTVDRKFLEFVEIYMPKMPDVQRMARNISTLIATGVESEVKRGRDSLESVAFEVQRAIGNTLPRVKEQLRAAGERLERTAEDIALLLGRNIEFVNGPAIQSQIDSLQTYIDEYGPYRFYVGIGMASLVLLILLCFAFGLACGCYGKRPADPYDDEFGTKGTGASCLMAGVGLLFMTSLVLMLLTTAHFLVGAIGEKLSCEVLNNLGADIDGNSQQQELHDFVNRILPLTQLYPHGVVKDDVVTVSNIVRECHRNRTLYEMLQLERVLDVTSLSESVRRMNISEEVRRLTANLAFDQQMVLLTNSAKEQLRAFANSEVLSVNFTAYSLALERDITNVNLLDMAIVLNSTAMDIQPYSANSANILWNNSLFLEALQTSHLLPMKAAAQRLRAAASALEQRVRFNQSSLPEAIEMLIEQADAAQKFLRSQGPQELTKLAVEFGKECERLIDDYVNRVSDHVISKIGKCGPLSQAYNTTAGVVCQQIFYPFNGFWASIGWCVLLFLPCVALALILAKLYRKTDPYPGSLVETEYMYDAYADRDNIPLALNNRDRRGMAYPAGGGRSGHSYGHVYGYEDDYSYSQHQARTGRSAASSSSSGNGTNGSAVVAPAERNGKNHTSRYQDVAPRAWSESSPSRASPRYVASPVHAPSTSVVAGQQPTAPVPDYPERPPPYYYPGPADIK